MNNPICISTGCVHRLFEDRNRSINLFRQFSHEGIEVSFAYPHHLLNFKIEEDNLEHLETLKFNSIHAPFKDYIYKNNEKSKEILRRISDLYKRINARNVVFHKDSIKDYDFIANNGFVVSLENDDWRKPNNTINHLKDILDNNEKFKFTFDFAHALSTSSDIDEYINCLGDKIVEIHLSIIDEDSKRHTFLHKKDSEELRKKLHSLKSISVPIVLECDISNLEKKELLRKEIDYIRNI